MKKKLFTRAIVCLKKIDFLKCRFFIKNKKILLLINLKLVIKPKISEMMMPMKDMYKVVVIIFSGIDEYRFFHL